MSWRCERCGEEHGDQFDACWRCAQVASSGRKHDSKAMEYLQRYGLLAIKFVAAMLAGKMAFTGRAYEQHGLANLFAGLFAGSLLAFFPQVRWIPPLVIIGFCIGPTFFAPTINSSPAQELNASATGAAIGLVLGISLSMFGNRSTNR